MPSDPFPRTVRYRRTQRASTLLLGILGGIALVLVVALVAAAGGDPAPLAVPAAVLVGLISLSVLFSSLTVEVDDEALRIAFGPGLVRHAWSLDRIAAARPVRNPWWYGWGIHYTPGGWLYSVAGFEAVEIVLADGRRRRVGTDDPEGLVAALGAARPRWI